MKYITKIILITSVIGALILIGFNFMYKKVDTSEAAPAIFVFSFILALIISWLWNKILKKKN